MSLSPRTDHNFIESVILYEVNNWTTVDEVCENLRKLVGVISKSCSLLDLSVESITKFVKDMRVKDVGAIQKDQNFIRSVFLYEFLIGEKDKDKIYKKMLRRIGSDLIYCAHFSHWYCQFKNGNYDFDDDSLASESPTFSDLPIDVIGLVVEKLDLKAQLSLRKVSKNLRSLVDKQKPAYKTIIVLVGDNHMFVRFNDEYVGYCDYVEIAFNDVAIAMKNPKLQLESLKIADQSMSENEIAAKFYEKMENLLETLNHKISVEEFSIMTKKQHELMSILPYLKPKKLKVIGVHDDYSGRATNFDIEKIADLDQWKYAKNVKIGARILTPFEHFFHFYRFDIYLHSLSVEDLILIRDEVFKSSKFQYLYICCDDKPSFVEIERIFGVQVHLNTQDTRVYHLLIPHSNEFFQFSITGWSISIERKSR